MSQPAELTAAQLRRRFNTARFEVVSTADVPTLTGIIGQEHAARAIEFGLEMPFPGYNVFATGPDGAGKTSIITRYLQDKAAGRAVPDDWGYIHNFAEPDRPRAVRLPPGQGARLRDQVNALLLQMMELLGKAFGSEQYAQSRNEVGRQFEQMRDELTHELDAAAQEQAFKLESSENGIMLVPLKDDKPLTEEQFSALPEDEREAYGKRGQALQEQLERTMRQVQELEQAARDRLLQLDRDIAGAAIGPLFTRLGEEYAGWPDVQAYLAGVQASITDASAEFRSSPSPAQEAAQPPAGESGGLPAWLRPRAASPLDRYRLNLLVDNSGLSGAPVIVETNPTHGNLIGRVEMRAEFGTLVTDYRQIKPGALHKANGGYLLLDARELLRQPNSWDALKQALRNKQIRMEDETQQAGVLATTTLAPEPIPLDVKVVLVGDPATYYALYQVDDQFSKLFKVRADFAEEMDWTIENEESVLSFIRNRCEEYGLPHFDLSAVAAVIEYSSRLVEDQRKLTTRFALVSDLIQEAAFWAGRAGHAGAAGAGQHGLVTGADVEKAIQEQIYRSNQYEERVREMICDGTIMVATAGAAVGQVNGLAVLELGDYAFGRPTRISARTFQGRAGVVNIEREARLSGRIHDKGILILSGFLGGRYAQDKPLSLSASIAFEQSYDGVDGDSASSTELYALLSSLAGLPLKQSIAVTGSVNQHGDVQPVGGVTTKVEGFFDVCRHMPGELTGEQGVVLPLTNAPNLMLRADVVEAVAEGRFHIWPVQTIDEGIEILTGMPAGERDAEGKYPAESVNGRVDARLRDLAEKLQNFGRPNGEGGREHKEPEPPPDTSEPALPGDQPEPAGEDTPA